MISLINAGCAARHWLVRFQQLGIGSHKDAGGVSTIHVCADTRNIHHDIYEYT